MRRQPGRAVDQSFTRRRQVWKSGFATKKAAEAALRSFMSAVETGADPYPADLTVRDFTARWLASDRVTKLRPHTQSRYRQVLEHHLLPVLGSLRLAEVRARHVRAALDAVKGKGLSSRSVVEARAILSSAMTAAVEDEVIEANPVAGVRVGAARRRALSVPTADQLAALIEASKGTAWELPLLLAATTGMRRSEVLALRWRYVDLDTGEAQVVVSLQRIRDDAGSRIGFLDCKTDRSKPPYQPPGVRPRTAAAVAG